MASLTSVSTCPHVSLMSSPSPCRTSLKASQVSSIKINSTQPSSRFSLSSSSSSWKHTFVTKASVEVENDAAPIESNEEVTTVANQETVPNAEATPVVEKRRPSTVRRRKITVPTEELEPGKQYQGKVRSVQSFGAFVDFGAFTDGLVHISELSNGFVAKVEDIVTVGAEVTVRVKDVDVANNRIALTMRDREAEAAAAAAAGESGSRADRSNRSSGNEDDFSEGGRPARKIAGRGRRSSKDDQKVNHNHKKGQVVKGVVKNLTAYGCFIDLGEGVEGLLHNEESSGITLSTGEEVKVKILKVEKNRISLTIREEVDLTAFNESLSGEKLVVESADSSKAGNPFVLAFRQANLVPETFVDETTVGDAFIAGIEKAVTIEAIVEEVKVEAPAE